MFYTKAGQLCEGCYAAHLEEMQEPEEDLLISDVPGVVTLLAGEGAWLPVRVAPSPRASHPGGRIPLRKHEDTARTHLAALPIVQPPERDGLEVAPGPWGLDDKEGMAL